MSESASLTAFAPTLSLKVLAPALEFYKKAFGVTEVERFMNDDGSIHVAILLLEGVEFYLHEAMPGSAVRSPDGVGATTVELSVFVSDPPGMMKNAVAAGARVVAELKDHFYGLQQGTIVDPFGHCWTLQKKIPKRERDE